LLSVSSQTQDQPDSPDSRILAQQGLASANHGASTATGDIAKENTVHFDCQEQDDQRRAKRISIIRHKGARSVDVRYSGLQCASPTRPASSSGVPMVSSKSPKPVTASEPRSPQPGHKKSDSNTSRRMVSRRPSMPLEEGMGPKATRVLSKDSALSDYDPSVSSGDQLRPTSSYEGDQKTPKGGKSRWISHVKDWFSTSEPSAQGWKEYKKDQFRKYEVDPKDPHANAKLHAPIGKVPKDAIRPSSGLNPEKARQKTKFRRSYGGATGSDKPLSSASESTTSVGQHNPIAPWAG
jgi:hypothetical protein